jgi:hypothetical protein
MVRASVGRFKNLLDFIIRQVLIKPLTAPVVV